VLLNTKRGQNGSDMAQALARQESSGVGLLGDDKGRVVSVKGGSAIPHREGTDLLPQTTASEAPKF
jgi:hypothetical protein